jgi:hypothetical protein
MPSRPPLPEHAGGACFVATAAPPCLLGSQPPQTPPSIPGKPWPIILALMPASPPLPERHTGSAAATITVHRHCCLESCRQCPPDRHFLSMREGYASLLLLHHRACSASSRHEYRHPSLASRGQCLPENHCQSVHTGCTAAATAAPPCRLSMQPPQSPCTVIAARRAAVNALQTATA